MKSALLASSAMIRIFRPGCEFELTSGVAGATGVAIAACGCGAPWSGGVCVTPSSCSGKPFEAAFIIPVCVDVVPKPIAGNPVVVAGERPLAPLISAGVWFGAIFPEDAAGAETADESPPKIAWRVAAIVFA